MICLPTAVQCFPICVLKLQYVEEYLLGTVNLKYNGTSALCHVKSKSHPLYEARKTQTESMCVHVHF